MPPSISIILSGVRSLSISTNSFASFSLPGYVGALYSKSEISNTIVHLFSFIFSTISFIHGNHTCSVLPESLGTCSYFNSIFISAFTISPIFCGTFFCTNFKPFVPTSVIIKPANVTVLLPIVSFAYSPLGLDIAAFNASLIPFVLDKSVPLCPCFNVISLLPILIFNTSPF